MPGGKIDQGETATRALCREIGEEMNVAIDEHELHFHTHITAPAYGEQDGVIMEQDCFFLHRNISPRPSAEIGELKFFSLNDYLAESRRAPGAVMILELLQNEGLVD